MPPLNIFAYTNVAELLAAWLARAPASGVNARAVWLGKQIGCTRAQIWNLLSGEWHVQPEQVVALGRALELEGESLEYLRILAAYPNAPAEEMRERHASLWSAHAAKMGLPASAVAALLERRPVHTASESALLTLLPVLLDPGSTASAQEVESTLWSPPEPGVVGATLALAAQGVSVGELLSSRLLTLRGPVDPGSRAAAALHGLLEIARDGLLAVPAEDRDYHTLVWSADAQAEAEIASAREALGRDLRVLVRETAEERVDRIHLLWTEQVCLTTCPLPEAEGARVENAAAALSGGGGSSTGGTDRPDLSTAAPPCLYLYLDFVAFARAWIAWRRAKRKPCSAAWLGRRMGVSRSMAHYLVNGASRLRLVHLPGLARAFSLSEEELAYVEGMIQHARAVDLQDRVRTRQSLLSFAAAQGVRTLEGETFRVAAHWAPEAIYALAYLSGFQDDPAWISAALRGNICPADAADQVAALVTVGMLVPQPCGPARPSIPVAGSLPADHNLALFGLHDSVLRLIQDELQRPGAALHLSVWVIALPASALPRLRALLDAHKTEVLRHLQASDARATSQDRVLLVGVQLRPLTHPLVTSLAPRTRRR